MADDTNPKPSDTPEGGGKKTDGNGAGGDTPNPKPEDAQKFTQEDIDRIAAKARKEEREKWQREQERKERERQEQADKEAGKHQELAQKFERERDEERTRADNAESRYGALSERVTAMLAAEIDALPDEVKQLAPPALEDRLEWLPKAKQLAARITGNGQVPGAPRDPKPAGGIDTAEQSKAEIVTLRRRGGYGF